MELPAEDRIRFHPMSAPASPTPRPIGLGRLVMLLLFIVSGGGAYGLEDLIGQAGPGAALALLVVTPLVWCLPTALMVAELSAALPGEGGYYLWVKRGLSPFWGFQEAWWSWINSWVDMTIYPVLAVSYATMLLEQRFGMNALPQGSAVRWLTTLAVIWLFAWWNLRGAGAVGASSVAFGAFTLAPFALLSAAGVAAWLHHPAPFWQPWRPPEGSAGGAAAGSLAVGLCTAMFNYQGWDNAAPFAGEIRDPQRTYPRALALAIPLVVLAYLLPVIAGLTAIPDSRQWRTGSFPRAAAILGGAEWGPALADWLAAGGIVAAAGTFNALLLAMSRLPAVLAKEGFLPAALARKNPRTGAPTASVLLCAAIYSLYACLPFTTLVVVDVFLYAAGLLLEFLALIALRLREPDLPRPFRIPGGWPMLIFVCAAPATLLALAIALSIQENGVGAVWLSAAALASGPLIYPLLKDRFTASSAP